MEGTGGNRELAAKKKDENKKRSAMLVPEPARLPTPPAGLVTLTFEVARLCAPEAGGQLLQSLRQGGHHVAKEPLLLLRAGPAGPAGQSLHRALAPVEELGEQAHGSQQAGEEPKCRRLRTHVRPLGTALFAQTGVGQGHQTGVIGGLIYTRRNTHT